VVEGISWIHLAIRCKKQSCEHLKSILPSATSRWAMHIPPAYVQPVIPVSKLRSSYFVFRSPPSTLITLFSVSVPKNFCCCSTSFQKAYITDPHSLGCDMEYQPPSSAEVRERVELYLFSPSGSSWPFLGRTLPLPLPYSITEQLTFSLASTIYLNYLF